MNLMSIKDKDHIPVHNSKPPIPLPEPVIMLSPTPVNELDAAASKLQKVYKGYRTRRNLADCAVVVEELWWKALDFAALRQGSVSFFNIEKPETAISRWKRVRTRVAKIGKGLSKDENAQNLAPEYWLEAIDPRHRYGPNLNFYYDAWSNSTSTQPFFYWLDVGDGKELNLESCQRIFLQRQCIKYLGPIEREAYEVIVDSGKLTYKQNGILLNTIEGSKWIFVISTSRTLYVGQKKKGVFQHSSFLSGGATTAAGRLVAHDGILEAIWPYCNHYNQTEEDNFKEFISFLEEYQVDLTNVKRCAIDDDSTSFKVIDEESKTETVDDPSTAKISTDIDAANINGFMNDKFDTISHEEDGMGTKSANVEEPVFDLSKRLSCKWTSGVGPRIGCVRDYPMELQTQALEQVNLSPKLTPGHSKYFLPIPSPRPSPKIRVSPRFAYMGLPSPRPIVSTASEELVMNFRDKDHIPVHNSKPPISLPEPVIMFSPTPVNELDAAATQLQKVYKSYRTRRNLADCAVVVEELWWKALDFAALKQSSVSFFNIEKPETAVSRWERVRTRVTKIGKGLSKDENAQKLAPQYWLEAIDPHHRYGPNLRIYYDAWSNSTSTQSFFYWLDVGDGNELNLQSCLRIDLERQCIRYLGPKEREAYEVIVDNGKLIYKLNGILLNTIEGSKWIFVLSTSRTLYVGQKKEGVFQHTSFLSGGATTAAGRLVAYDGILEAILPYCDYYHQTEDNFKEFVSFLEEYHVDLTNVKRSAVDDDSTSFKVIDEESKTETVDDLSTAKISTDIYAANINGSMNDKFDTTSHEEEDGMGTKSANVEEPVFDLPKRLYCKWTSGVGPRIGCVRDYPMELQTRALEQVNLSPKTVDDLSTPTINDKSNLFS